MACDPGSLVYIEPVTHLFFTLILIVSQQNRNFRCASMCSLECEQLINLEGLQGACNSRSESLQAAPIAFN